MEAKKEILILSGEIREFFRKEVAFKSGSQGHTVF